MRLPSIALHHQALLAAAVFASICGIYGLSKAVTPRRPAIAPVRVTVSEPSPPAERSTVLPEKVFVPPDFEALMPAAPPQPRLTPAFMAAVGDGDLQTMNTLYEKGMPLDGTLVAAARTGKRPVVAWLLERGANVHEAEGDAEAPIVVADTHADIVKLLLARGAAEPELVVAARAGAPNAVRRLIGKHAVVNPTDGDNPLWEAIISTVATPQNKRAVVEVLLAAGAAANPDDATQSPMIGAVSTCTEEAGDLKPGQRPPRPQCLALIQLLGSRGARVSGEALQAAIGHPEPLRDAVLDVLLAQRLEPNATAVALGEATADTQSSTKKLLAHGVTWSWHDGEEDAKAPLLDAIDRADPWLVRAMLDAGAPANLHLKDGRSPLGLAIEKATANTDDADTVRVVELLVARGAGVNQRLPDGRTPLFAAAESGDLRLIRVILDRGARVNEVVLDATALDAAETGGHTPAARVLHSRGGRHATPAQAQAASHVASNATLDKGF